LGPRKHKIDPDFPREFDAAVAKLLWPLVMLVIRHWWRTVMVSALHCHSDVSGSIPDMAEFQCDKFYLKRS